MDPLFSITTFILKVEIFLLWMMGLIIKRRGKPKNIAGHIKTNKKVKEFCFPQKDSTIFLIISESAFFI